MDIGSLEIERKAERAKRRIESFQADYPESVRDDLALFAQYAAFPLSLTSELAYGLREQFTPGLGWDVAPTFLLSSLCESIGYDLYEIDADVRDQLRLQLVERLATVGKEGQLFEIADYLGRYILYRLKREPTNRMKVLGDPARWIALACLMPSEEVTQTIERELRDILAREGDVSERLRLASVVQSHSDLLAQRGFKPFDLQNLQALAQRLEADEPIDEMDVLEQFLRDQGWPELKMFTVEQVRLLPSQMSEPDQLELFTFSTVKVNRLGKIVDRPSCEAYRFREVLGDGIPSLDMIAIPSGRYLMGLPENELNRSNSESPQHRVTVPPFFISQFSITQAQWRFIAQKEDLQHDRELDADPSRFKGDNAPVEQVSWEDATEFCKRLATFTQRDEYRLPTEAEWEYACRAGTTTPFAFGETITTDLANFDGNYIYGSAWEGKYRQKTTDVGYFYPNALGLYDMHGNVLEWCQDTWHDSYNGAPEDGTAWGNKDNYSRYVLRGGAWKFHPEDCRSAFRYRNIPGARLNFYGFRVVCAVPRPPLASAL